MFCCISLSLSCYTCLAYFGIIIVISFRSLRQRLEHSSHSSSLLSSPLLSLVLLVEVFWGHVRLGAFSSAGNSLKASEISAAFFPAPAFQRFSRFSRFGGLHLPFTSGLDCPVPNSLVLYVLCLRAFSPPWSTIFRAKLSDCFVPPTLWFLLWNMTFYERLVSAQRREPGELESLGVFTYGSVFF